VSTDLRSTDEWGTVVGFLPADLDKLAKDCGAVERWREFLSGSDLVRTSLVYGLDDMSLRETSVWASEFGIANVSDVAILKRLKRAVPLLRYLCSSLIAPPVRPMSGLRLVIEDATTICRQRSQGPDFRAHMAYNPATAQFTGMELTRSDQGERLDRLECGPGDVLVADMGYQSRKSLGRARDQGAHIVVRFYPTSLPLESLEGVRISPFELAEPLHVGQSLDIPVRTVATKDAPCVEGRMIVVRKPDVKVAEGLARKKREKGKELGEQAKRAEKYVMVFATLPQHKADTMDVLEIYRIRWQVEMSFKRVKGVISLGETLARDMDLCECKILAKLLTLLLIQAYEKAFFPWGYPLSRKQLASGA
jgi:Transposase DDE domain